MLKKPLHIAISPLSNRIYAGHAAKDGLHWLTGKEDVTAMACAAVCSHVLAKKGTAILTCADRQFKITVEELF